LRIVEPSLIAALDDRDPERPNLFAFPAQSNFSGVKHPLSLIARARERGWRVLLDVAAFAPTLEHRRRPEAIASRLERQRWTDGRGSLSCPSARGLTGSGHAASLARRTCFPSSLRELTPLRRPRWR
jgi:hypothetical protein